jgi:hypothetical protein
MTSCDNDMNLVEHWVKKDPSRWAAGLFAGIFAAVMAAVVGGIVAEIAGYAFLFPVRLMAAIPLGASATDTAFGSTAVILGAGVLGLICVFFGIAYAHFVPSNRPGPLLAMGAVWGIYSWIFVWNLFLPAFRVIRDAQIPSGAALPVCMVYGLSLASVSFFHRMFGGGK